jgi:hypothetical protein
MLRQISFGIVLLTFSSGCQTNSTTLRNENCSLLQTQIQREFDLKDYNKTISLFKSFEGCLNDKEVYLNKLGLLYYVNNQDSLSNQTFIKLFELLENKKGISDIEKAFTKGSIYAMLNKREELQLEIDKIAGRTLTSEQKERLQYLELFSGQGEFTSSKFKVQFELFDKEK